MPNRPAPRFFTIPNAAKKLGITRQRIHSLIKAGLLRPSEVEGVGRVIHAGELQRFQAERRTRKPRRRGLRRKPPDRRPVTAPVDPFPNLLNFSDPNFTWQDFENFSEAFISSLTEVKEVHFYGRRGGRQKGIDFLADMKNGQHWAFQARQWKTFNKTHVERAITETIYEADHYVLLISSQAGSEERDICAERGNWDIWDVRDISRKVRREIPPSDAARLIEAHFGPEWRKAFLGLPGIEAFVSHEEYFRPLIDPRRLFNHHWSLVGRSGTMKVLMDFVGQKERRIAVLTGRGGIGKTKILQSLAERLSTQPKFYEVQFLHADVALTPDMFDHIPVSPLLIFVDDAHHAEDLRLLLRFVQQRQYGHPEHPVKLVLSTRPQGIDRIRTLLADAGFDPKETIEVPEIRELDRSDVKNLARQVLGPHSQLVDRLATATRDSPLVTVVGGRLLRDRHINPALLENDDEFRRAVLTRFQDEAIGVLGSKVDAPTARSILTLITALAPVNFGSTAVVEKASEFLGVDSNVLVSTVGLLEQYGILVRRGRLVRVTPDVLSDHILREASINSQGVPTGYAHKVFQHFFDLQPANVLRNLAELDWRMYHTIGDLGLLNDIWAAIEREFRDAPNSARCAILDILEQAAFFQPNRVLKVIEFAIRNPATALEDPAMLRLYKYSHEDVLGRLPKLLRRIGYNLEYLLRACDLLWELGRDDRRDLNPNPDHAVRILTDLAGYDLDKPVRANEMVLEAVDRWLKAADAHDYYYSPLDVLVPLFAKTSYSTYSEGHAFVFRPFKVHHENTKPLRAKALKLLTEVSQSTQIRVVFKVLSVLEDALRGPQGFFGQEITVDDRQLWVSDQLEVLDVVGRIAKKSKMALVQLRVIEVLRWYTRYEKDETIRGRALEVTASIRNSQSIHLYRVLKDSFDLDLDDGDDDDSYEKKEQRVAKFRRAVSREFFTEHSDPSVGFAKLNQELAFLDEAGVRHNSSAFLYELSQARSAYAAQLCRMIVEHPTTPLSAYLAVLLSGPRKKGLDQAIDLTELALKTEDRGLWRAVADGYRVWGDSLSDRDIAILRQLLDHTDQNVQSLAIMALNRLAKSDKESAKRLAMTIDIRNSPLLAERIAELFDARWGISLDSITDDELASLVKKLERVTKVDDYHVSEFLANASHRIPETVVQLFLSRIERSTKTDDREYRPIPYEFHHRLDGLARSKNYKAILKKVRDYVLRRHWRARFWIPHLFKEVSLGYSPESLAVLGEWIESGREAKIVDAAALLHEADSDFVFAHHDFVVKLIQRAHAVGEDCLQKVESNLFASAASGVRAGTPGEPMPQDVELRDRASSTAREFVVGSPEHSFYEKLARHADQEIRRHLLEDEEVLD